MNKLIEEAESLYKQINKAQVHLINARLNNDEKGKKSAISEIETAMCDASRLLKCFIDRKDNIVDLSEVWHNIDEESKPGWIILQNKYDETDFIIMELECTLQESWFNTNTIGRWAYLFDLLPKGAEKWQKKNWLDIASSESDLTKCTHAHALRKY